MVLNCEGWSGVIEAMVETESKKQEAAAVVANISTNSTIYKQNIKRQYTCFAVLKQVSQQNKRLFCNNIQLFWKLRGIQANLDILTCYF